MGNYVQKSKFNEFMLLLRVGLPNIKHGFCRTRVNRPSADASSLFFRQELSPESDVPSESMKKVRGAQGLVSEANQYIIQMI